jgi:hypothetical protein
MGTLHHRQQPPHQVVVEIPPPLQAVHRQPLDELLALERKPLILLRSVVMDLVGQLEEFGILQQGAHQ